MLEPRGHADMCGAILTEPVSPGSHAGVLFMHNDGYSTMCGHGIIAVTTIALERGLLMPGGDGQHHRLRHAGRNDSGARHLGAGGPGRSGRTGGGVRAFASRACHSSTCRRSCCTADCRAARRADVRADVAFGGAFYAIVDSEAVGLPIDAAHLPELRRAGMAIKRAIEAAHDDRSSARAGRHRHRRHDLHRARRSDERRGPAQRRRLRRRRRRPSPCGTGTAAVMAVVDAMGLLDDEQAVRSRERSSARVSPAVSQDARRSATIRRSSPRSKGRRGSPASTRS